MLSSPEESGNLKKIVLTDNTGTGSKMDSLFDWWTNSKGNGALIGYYPKPSKTRLLAKPEFQVRAWDLFNDVNIMIKGRSYLGSFIGFLAQSKQPLKEKYLSGTSMYLPWPR